MRRQQITMKAGFDLALNISSQNFFMWGGESHSDSSRRRSFFLESNSLKDFCKEKENVIINCFNGNKTVFRKPAETKGHR